MELWRLIDKLGRGQRLSENELMAMRDEMRALSEIKNLVKGWVTPGTNTPNFRLPVETIYSQVLAVDTASLTIPIPNNYSHLWVFGAGRSTDPGTNYDYLLCRFSGDSGANYINQKLYASATTVTATRDTSQQQGIIGLLAQDGRAAGDVAAFHATLPHYNNSSLNKNLMTEMTTAVGAIFHFATNWDSTDPVSSIEFFLSPGLSIKAGSIISIYGLR